MQFNSTAFERFIIKIDFTAECWLWTGEINDGGYGVFVPMGRKPYARAHRCSYELFVGPIPEGLQLDHLCRVRHCVRPEHLEAVHQYVNILRGVGWTAINKRKTSCPQGHPYTEENTWSSAKGWRQCRQCNRERHRVTQVS